jgi:hypothetical protein
MIVGEGKKAYQCHSHRYCLRSSNFVIMIILMIITLCIRDNSMIDSENRDELWTSGDANDKVFTDTIVIARSRSNTISFPSTHVHDDGRVIEIEANTPSGGSHPPSPSSLSGGRNSNCSQESTKSFSSKSTKRERIFAGESYCHMQSEFILFM